MEHDLVVEGKIVLPGSVELAQVGISDGVIREIKKQGLRGSKIVKADGCLVFPGFIDAHVHLREPGWEYKEDFRTGTRAAIHGGVTTLIDMPNNPTPTDTPEALDQKFRLAEQKSVASVEFHAGVSPGRLNGLAQLGRKAAGYKVYLSRTTGRDPFPAEDLHRALSLIRPTRRPVGFHCEDESIIDMRTAELKDVRRADIHCDIRPPESEVRSVEAVIAAVGREDGLRANVCHASTAGALKAVSEASARGLEIKCEATLHHLYFNRSAMLRSPLLKTNPPLRAEEDRQALVDGLRNGAVDFLVTDHAPHTKEEKVEGLAGVPGLDDYGHMVAWLLRSEGFDPLRISRVTSADPASFFGLADRGEISVGKRADLAILDVHSPEKVRPENVLSKCGWSPYEGVEFPGKVRWTVRSGELAQDDSTVIV